MLLELPVALQAAGVHLLVGGDDVDPPLHPLQVPLADGLCTHSAAQQGDAGGGWRGGGEGEQGGREGCQGMHSQAGCCTGPALKELLLSAAALSAAAAVRSLLLSAARVPDAVASTTTVFGT